MLRTVLGQALAVPPGIGEKAAVEAAEVGWGEPLQLDVAQPGTTWVLV
jgi:hypothetical protein